MYKIVFSGRVQGVCFRVHIKRKSLELGLRGYVKNQEDGTVLVICQGSEFQIKRLIEFIKSSPGISKVNELISGKVDMDQEFDSFKIRY
ncbi:MAG: acylphosphatase [Candidatus Woesearchaeota archaeon]